MRAEAQLNYAGLKNDNLKYDKLNHDVNIEFAKNSIQLAMAQSSSAVATCKFNPDSCVFLHIILSAVPDIPVVWVDTGFNSAETVRYVESTRAMLNINLHVYRPTAHDFNMPPNTNAVEHEAFVKAVKVEPFERAMQELQPDVWFSSLRRYQTDYRAERNVFERSSPNLLKALPLLNWTREDIDYYRNKYDLPEGPVVIDPTKRHERVECGLHVVEKTE